MRELEELQQYIISGLIELSRLDKELQYKKDVQQSWSLALIFVVFIICYCL